MPNKCLLTLKNVTDKQAELCKTEIVDNYIVKQDTFQKTGNGMYMFIMITPMSKYGITKVMQEVFNDDQFEIVFIKKMEEKEDET